MCQLDLMPAHGEREGTLGIIELAEDGADLVIRLRRAHLANDLVPYLLGFDVIAKAKKYRRAQEAVVGPVLEFHFRDDFRLDPDGGIVELWLLHERTAR